MIAASIVGASGYVGGELLRLLLGHPQVEVVEATSESSIGKYLYQVHPHLRGRTSLRFTSRESLQACDVRFLALPHGEAQNHIEQFARISSWLIDLSADFRLRSAALYAHYCGPHPAAEWLERFAYGLPEINRDPIRTSRYASGVGCNAAATILALQAVVRAGLLEPGQPIIADIKAGSSEAGSKPTDASHHPARSGVVRPFQLTGHRHEAEVRQAFADCGEIDVRLAVTSVEMVRGVSAAVHVSLRPGTTERTLWEAYRAAWSNQPFVRIVHEKTGIHRHPEPRLVAGTNYADVGWEFEPQTGRAVLLCALDNLGKGAAGSAVQCMNLMTGLDETTGLNFGGYYP